ncbi:hypothetical protein MUK42_20283 [Musa troglodytarum]|uniref:Uncharacterized protein n=1 Tax=Musa troglodytarum TaxID=320322 RepID=A0A9E7G249_9LILI|nr:hypothetical protein MUK42_20283 [Musa troglodytarum]
MARLLSFVPGDRSYGADSTSQMTGILFMLGLVAATISIMAVVLYNCGDSYETKPKPNKRGAAGAATAQMTVTASSGGGCGGGGGGGGCGGGGWSGGGGC